MNRARWFDGGRRPKIRSGDGVLFNLVRPCEQVIEVEDRVQMSWPDGETFLQAQIERSGVGEPVSTVWIRVDRLGTLVQVGRDHEPGKRLPVLVPCDDSETDVRRKPIDRRPLCRERTIAEQSAARVGRSIGINK